MVEEGKEQTDAYRCHAINAQYNVRTARLAVLHAFAPRIVLAMSFAETLPGQASGARMQTPSYIFDCYTPLSGLVFGKEQFVFREFVFWGHASRLRGIRLWDGSIFGEQFVFREFVFGKEFVFGGAI